DPDRRCVDRDSYDSLYGYKVVADQNCKSTTSGSTSTGRSQGKRTGSATATKTDADWYYDADVDGGWADYGTFSKSEAVDRGGFGCSGSGGSSGG
ncbi:hypothetical protein, partial [Streptomyces griseoruber]